MLFPRPSVKPSHRANNQTILLPSCDADKPPVADRPATRVDRPWRTVADQFNQVVKDQTANVQLNSDQGKRDAERASVLSCRVHLTSPIFQTFGSVHGSPLCASHDGSRIGESFARRRGFSISSSAEVLDVSRHGRLFCLSPKVASQFATLNCRCRHRGPRPPNQQTTTGQTVRSLTIRVSLIDGVPSKPRPPQSLITAIDNHPEGN